MMQFIELNEIMDINKDGVVTEPIFVRTGSLNAFRVSMYAGTVTATQVMMQNDCVWVTDTPDDLMQKYNGIHKDQS